MKSTFSFAAIFVFAVVSAFGAEEQAALKTGIKLAKGRVVMSAPKIWVSKTPKFKGIVDYEFTVPAAKDGENPGRVTIGGAGGGVEANFNRWKGQFAQSSVLEQKLEVAGQTVHVLDLKGTYKGSRFRNEPEQENFRMLAAIIVTEKAGSYYVKFYGSRKLVAANEGLFRGVINSLKVAAKK